MILLIDKPKAMTSHDVVNIVRRHFHEKRVGHAGTLDPNATGLLIVAVGREDTKKLGTIAKDTQKTYIAEITLGSETDTDDAEGKAIKIADPTITPIKEEIEKTLLKFIGTQKQIPPQYSAIKKEGKKAYENARKGVVTELAPRDVTIYKARLLEYKYPILSVEFEVSSGTYIRSIARDLGRTLNTYGHLSNLRRTRIGEFSIDNAQTLKELSERK